MNRESVGQVLQCQRRDGNHLGIELREGFFETIEVRGVWQQGQIQIPTKLRCAV